MSKIFEAMDKVKRQRELGSASPRPQPHATRLGPVPVRPPEPPEVFETPILPENEASELSFGGHEPVVVKEGQFGSPDPHLVSLVRPDCFESERYRALRHMIEERKREGLGLVLAITSPTHNDGKTLTSLNLAGALAQEREARILVIDADLRLPKVARSLALKQSSGSLGLGGLVVDRKTSLLDAIRYHRRYNLNVLAGLSPVSLPPYEILKSDRLGALLGETRRHFDYVVVDLPPMTYPDGQVLEKNVDATLLVIAADRTPRKLIEAARDGLDPAKLLGVVFNRDRERLAGYYYKSPRKPNK